ncbi:hypothetical protein HO173_009712 [Letharia columbiana]|uniref:TauD/TfdA-like domain-containing protein n=1 Tax=Letharia columbiana TaxID=112416 RepID=A0A8H6FP52_9LECA|nr:uncharacterized protein HO173_009712 [Letharia columbiana]KAF6232118.1 hypothetical protein HO173_009712 [Letharia columbiana]
MNVSFPNVRHTKSRIAHNGGGDTRLRDSYAPRTTSMSWHTDSSANPPPPGLIFLYMLECPDVGGDTVSVNTAEAYKILSRPCAERLQGLKAEHKVGTGVSSVLPVVRTHLVTGEKCLVVNPLCPSLSDQISFPVPHAENMVSLASDTTNIIGFKKEEKRHSAQVLLRASRLFPTMSGPGSSGPSEDTVVIFDNRATAHSAIFDFIDTNAAISHGCLRQRRSFMRLHYPNQREYEEGSCPLWR